MADLTLTYGTMAAGKSTLALQLAHQLRLTRGDVEVWTFGDRSGVGKVCSRLGLEVEAEAVATSEDLGGRRRLLVERGVRVLVVDEVQFATASQVDQLAFMVDEHDIDVHCFGLGADFLLQPFAGTARLFAIADEVHELPLAAYCWCGRPGRCNARIQEGRVVREGDQQIVGDLIGDTRYQVLCRRHYRTGDLG